MALKFPRVKRTKVACSPFSLVFAILFLLSVSWSDRAMAQDLTITTGGETGTSGTNWSISGNTLSVGSSGSASIHPSVITDHLLNTGDLTITLPWQSLVVRNTYINNSIAYSGANGRTLIINSPNNIVFANATGITSSTASLNVVLRTATGESANSALIKMDGITLNTNGGHFWAGGGSTSTTWNGLTVGNSAAVTVDDDNAGISIVGSTITTNGGNLRVFALSNNGIFGDDDGVNYGINVQNSTVSSGTGDIYFNADLYGRYTNGTGMRVYGTTATSITSTTGSIYIRGYGTDATTNGNSWRHAAAIQGSAQIRSVSGNITVTGDAAFAATVNDKEGLMITDGASICSQSGNITLRGTNTLETSGQYSNSIRFAAANVANSIRIGYDGTNAYSGNITIEGNSIYQRATNAGAGSIAVQTTGTLTIQPTGNAFTYMRAGDAGTLTFDDDWNFGTTLSGFTVGKSTNTTNLTFANVLSTAGPITMYGGIVTLSNNLTTTASGGAILVKATDQVNTAASLTFTTNNGDFILWSDSDNSSGGRVWLGNNNVINTANGSTSSGLSGGGKIVLAGGLDNGANGGTASDGIPDGFAANASSIGVYLGNTASNYTQMYSGGGDILVRGASTLVSSSSLGSGVYSDGRWLANAGKGSITIHGTSAWYYGINFSAPVTNTTAGDKHLQLISDKASGTAISITGTGTNYHGVVFNYLNPKEVLATGGGAIVINGTAGAYGPGVFLQNTDILATSGDITVNGSGSGTAGIYVTSYGARFGSRTGTDITSSTSNIRWSVNSMTLEGLTTGFTNNFTTTGTATIEPSGTSFASAVTVPISNFTIASTVTGLTIGKTTNTANVTVSGAISLSAPIAIYGGTVAINAAVTATGSTLTLGASTALTQAAAVSATNLLLTGAGTFTLTGSSNDVGTIAGGTSGSRLGSLSYTEASGALTIGTVGSTSGIYTTGTLQVETLTGNINLTQPVSSSSTSTNAVIINAGKNAAALTASGGDIIVTGSPTVTVGSGGVGKLFSGLAIYSTGLTTLAGGSANVRNGFDENSSISPALSGNTNYAIYRATLGVGDLTIVASGGDALSSYKWIYDNGVISTAASTVSINASDLVSYLGTGNLTVEAGHVTINSAITSSAANAFVINTIWDKTITVNAAISLGGSFTINGDVLAMGNGIGISTSTASNIIINLTRSFRTDGTTRRTISSAGGNITIHADSDANGSGELNLDYLTLDPGVGNVIIRGESFNFSTTAADKPFIRGTGTFTLEPSDAGFGNDMQTDWFKLDEAGHIKSGVTFGKVGNTSNFSLNHAGGLTVAGPIAVYGSYITNSTPLTSSATGDIFFKGLWDVANTSTITKSGGTGTFTMQGNAQVTNTSSGVITTSGSGVLNVVLWSDFDNSNSDGGTGHWGTISTNGGHVWLGGSNSNGGSYTWNGITVGNGPSIGTYGRNAYAMDLMGSATTNGGDFLAWAGPSDQFVGIGQDGNGDIVSVGTGDIILITDALTGSGASPIYFTQSGGTFTLVPDGGSFASAFDWNPTVSTALSGTNDDYKLGSGNFTYLGIGDMNSISRLTIGYFNGMLNGSTPVEFTNSSNVTISTATTAGGAVEFYGGAITVSAALTAAGNILLDGDLGSFLTQNTHGVTINAAVTTTSNGNITILGRGGSGNAQSGNFGVQITRTVEAGGSGTIAVTGFGGLSGNGISGSSHGVNLDGSSAWIKSNGGNVTVTGNGGGANTGTFSQGVVMLNSSRISAGGSGVLTITGTGGVNTVIGLRGVVINSSSSVFTAGGAININGYHGTNGSDNSDGVTMDNATIGSNTSGPITITGTAGGGTGSEAISLSTANTIGGASHAGNITLSGNSFSFAGTNTVQTTGQVAIEPASTSFSAALNYPISNLTITSTGLRLGKSGNTANLNFTNNVSVPGPITVYAGPVSLAANLTTTGSGDISIYSDASLTATGSRTATAAGLFKYMPDGTSFSSAVSYPIGNLTVSSNGLQLGKPGNTAALTITGAASSNGPVTVHTGAFNTNATATLTATSSALTVNASGNVTLNAALAGSTTTVNVQGNLQTTGSLTNVNLEGGNAQSISGTADLTNLILNKSAGTATLTSGRQNLAGTLTLTSGTLAAGGFLTLKSSAAGTARVAQHATSTGNVTGNVVVERFVPGSRKMQWRMVAFPYNADLTLSNITGIKINYTSPQTMMYFRENLDDGINYGNGGTRNGGYQVYTANNQTIPLGRGVAAWVYGDESTSTTPGAGTLGAGGITVSSLGELNETGADVSIPITNLASGWNLVGNPFASTIDWELVRTAGTNLSATLYRWDPQAENWTLFNNSGGTTGNGSRFIESGSAFFVKSANTGAMTLTIPQSAKVTSAPDLHFTKNPLKLDIPGQRVGTASSLAGLRLKASGMGNPIPGEAYLDVSKTDATQGWDPQYDGLMMARSSGANVYFDGEKDNDYSMHFDAPLMNGEQRYYPITVTTPKAGETLIEVTPEGKWSSMHSVALIDKQLGRTILMRDGQLSYKLRLDELKSEGRFLLAINHVKLSADGQLPVFEAKALGNPVTNNVIDLQLTHPTAAPKRWRLVDAMGREAGVGVFATDAGIQHRLTVPGMRSSGVYVLQVELDNGETQQLRILKN